MKNQIITIVILIVIVLASVELGRIIKETEIKDRAKSINKESYTQTDLEIIIFNKP